MKPYVIVLIALFVAIMACSNPFGTPEDPAPGNESEAGSAPSAISEQRCGDAVCDGPETAANCSPDCGVQAGDDVGPPEKSPAESVAGAEEVLAQIFIEIEVERQDGVGTCGSEPWGVDHIDGGDFNCPPPKYWYGYDLSATALQNLVIRPSGGSSWQISAVKTGGGTYQHAEHWSDGERVCAPETIAGQVFDFETQGQVQNGVIELEFAARPLELSDWSCTGGNSYQRETTLLLIDWAVAMTGETSDLSATLSSEDRFSTGSYQRNYEATMNPSPEDRDHAHVTIDFKCLVESDAGVSQVAACPWN
jgi:hypothetical protein